MSENVVRAYSKWRNIDSRKSTESLREQGEFVAFEAQPSSFFLPTPPSQAQCDEALPRQIQTRTQAFFPHSQLWAAVSSWEAQATIFIFSQKDGENKQTNKNIWEVFTQYPFIGWKLDPWAQEAKNTELPTGLTPAHLWCRRLMPGKESQ